MTLPMHDPSRENRDSSPACDQGRLMVTAGLDGFEQHVLTLMRHMFSEMAKKRPATVPDPVHVAHATFGVVHGDRLMAALLQMVQTMSISRTEPFRYTNPFCPACAKRLTPEEEHLIRVLHHVRRGQDGRAIVHAVMLCDARDVAPLIEAAHELHREEQCRFC